MNINSIVLFGTVFSFVLHFFLFIPFIDFLYKKKMQRAHQKTIDPFGKLTPIFDKFNSHKVGTPVGGGILIISVTSILFLLYLIWFSLSDKVITVNYPSLINEIVLILFTFISFGFLGLYDDLSKIFLWKKSGFFGVTLRLKLFVELVLAFAIAAFMFFVMEIDIVHIPFIGVLHLSYFYILFAAFVIVAFANAVNITDGLDGLSSGVMFVALLGFWMIARSIIDVPTQIFISIWLGGILAFLYFNVPPARLWLGDTGALSYGATFAVIGLILGKALALPLIGGVFVVEIASTALQLASKKILKRKLFSVSPLHLWLQNDGWEESKVVFRMWIFAILFAVLGVATAFLE